MAFKGKSAKTKKGKPTTTSPTKGSTPVIGNTENRPESPYVINKMRHKSFLSEKVQQGIRQQFDKITTVEKEQQLATQEQVSDLEKTVSRLNGDIYSYQQQATQLENELDNLLKINDMYQETIKSLEEVIENKDRIIQDHLHTVGKLTEGNAEELKNIKTMFFSKQKDLVEALQKNKKK